MDYLEAKYPTPSLLPTDAIALAKARMAQLVALNELLPAVIKLIINEAQTEKSADWEFARLRAINTLNFLENLLGDSLYFAGEQLTMAEIVAGTFVYRMPSLGITLTDYPKLQVWSDLLLLRSALQQIELSLEEWSNFKLHMKVIPKIWERRRRQRINSLSEQRLQAI